MRRVYSGITMLYGALEFAYASPFAEALVDDLGFSTWVLSQTKFAPFAEGSVLLHEEMRLKRGAAAKTWWRSHFTEKCRCPGCSGQETDILAIFQAAVGTRFSLHFEVKQPTDRFPRGKDQAANYALRAKCWTTSPPKAVVQHSDAATVLLCSASKLAEYQPHLAKFGSVITFEDIASAFPHATIAV